MIQVRLRVSVHFVGGGRIDRFPHQPMHQNQIRWETRKAYFGTQGMAWRSEPFLTANPGSVLGYYPN